MPLPLNDLHRKLIDSPTSQSRAEVAQEIANGFAQDDFSANEKRIAIEIFRLLVNDAEIQVRKMLSTYLADSMDVPSDIILKLAHDVTEVAVHVLEKSYVLTEDDLIAITQSTHDVAVMTAIARRETVSCELSEALLKKSNLIVIDTLLRNKSASIHEKSLNELYDSFKTHSSILELMVTRGGLPVTLAEKLFVAVSDELKNVLTQQYKLPMHMADSSTKNVRELATLGLVGGDVQTMEITKLVDQLYREGRLTLSIIIRSLCLGDMRFFEQAMCKLADVPVVNVQLLVLDQGETGFKALYRTSCLPMELYAATHYLLKAVLEETSFGHYQRSDFRQRMANRLIQDETARKIEYMDYLITIIQNNARDVALTK